MSPGNKHSQQAKEVWSYQFYTSKATNAKCSDDIEVVERSGRDLRPELLAMHPPGMSLLVVTIECCHVALEVLLQLIEGESSALRSHGSQMKVREVSDYREDVMFKSLQQDGKHSAGHRASHWTVGVM
ncbi:hypothetical protein INR49_026895 [Caranx melampygus]|nr:hypothetical protein INR49_026895 [Caranx melampygus]